MPDPTSDEPMTAWAQTMQSALTEAISDFRREVNLRFDRLEQRVDDHAQQIKGAITLANAADNTAGAADIASLERDLARARAQAAHGHLISILQQQIAKLEDQVREMRDGKAA